ncbi:hypothetical protein BC830DRAFT_1168684 [Chytriomyces sp. MP71]|nr:hypothetical protein BC830DRAFT_1168684 [Chytriomyces sp. MP71]
MTKEWVDENYDGVVPCTTLDNPPQNLHCEYRPSVPFESADALWYFAPLIGDIEPDPSKPTIMHSTECAAYYPILYNTEFMKKFDYTMLYYRNSTAPILYAPFDIRTETTRPPGFAERVPRVAFVNRNCDDKSGRASITRGLIDLGVPVDAASECLHNVEGDSNANKTALFRSHRVCITMENSVDRDYVSEKLWDGFRGGCVPVYLGAPNILEDYAPTPDSMILVDKYDLRELADEIQLVLANEDVFNKYTSWRTKSFQQLSSGYRKTLNMHYGPSPQCQMCRVLLNDGSIN